MVRAYTVELASLGPQGTSLVPGDPWKKLTGGDVGLPAGAPVVSGRKGGAVKRAPEPHPSAPKAEKVSTRTSGEAEPHPTEAVQKGPEINPKSSEKQEPKTTEAKKAEPKADPKADKE